MTIAYVGSAGATNQSSTTTTVSYTSTAGNLLVVAADSGYSPGTSSLTISDSSGSNVWTEIIDATSIGSLFAAGIWYCYNAAAVTSVTVTGQTYSSSPVGQTIKVYEYSGFIAPPLTAGGGSSSVYLPGSLVAGATGVLIADVISTTSTAWSAGSIFSHLIQENITTGSYPVYTAADQAVYTGGFSNPFAGTYPAHTYNLLAALEAQTPLTGSSSSSSSASLNYPSLQSYDPYSSSSSAAATLAIKYPSGIDPVQTIVSAYTNGASVTATFPSPVMSGNIIVVVAQAINVESQLQINAPIDSQGNTYHTVYNTVGYNGGANSVQAQYRTWNVPGGTTTITFEAFSFCCCGPILPNYGFVAYELPASSTTDPLDQYINLSSVSPTGSGPYIYNSGNTSITTQANECLIGAFMTNSGVVSLGSGWSGGYLVEIGGSNMYAASMPVTSYGDYSATFNSTTDYGASQIGLATYKVAAVNAFPYAAINFNRPKQLTAAMSIIKYGKNIRSAQWTLNPILDPHPAIALPRKQHNIFAYKTRRTIINVPPPFIGTIFFNLAASLGMTAAKQNKTIYNISASSTITSILIKNNLILFNASISSLGALSKKISSLITSALGFSGTFVKEDIKVTSATINSATTITKEDSKSLAANVSSLGSLNKGITNLISAVVNGTGALFKQDIKLVSAAISSAASIAKKDVKNLTANIIPSSVITRQIVSLLAAIFSSTGTINKKTQRALTGTFSSTATLSGLEIIILILTATLSFTTNINKTIQNVIGAVLSTSTSIYKNIKALLIASTVLSGSLSKALSYIINSAMSLSGNATKRTIRSFNAVINGTTALIKFMQVVLTSNTSLSGNVNKASKTILSAILSSAGILNTGNLVVILTGTLSFVGSTSKNVFYLITGTFSSNGVLYKNIKITLSATAIFVGSAAKTLSRQLVGATIFVGSVTRNTIVNLLASLNTATQITKQAIIEIVGVITAATNVSKIIQKRLIANIDPITLFNRTTNKFYYGSVIASAKVSRLTNRFIFSTISSTAAITKKTTNTLSASLNAFGSIGRYITKAVQGTLGWAGNIITTIIIPSGEIFGLPIAAAAMMEKLYKNTIVLTGKIKNSFTFITGSKSSKVIELSNDIIMQTFVSGSLNVINHFETQTSTSDGWGYDFGQDQTSRFVLNAKMQVLKSLELQGKIYLDYLLEAHLQVAGSPLNIENISDNWNDSF